MATIDELSIEIKSSSQKAYEDVGKLSESLSRLGKSLKEIESVKLDGFKDAMKSISDSAKVLKGLNGFGNLAKSIQRTSKIQKTAESIKKVKKSADGLEDIRANIDTKDFDSAAESLQKRFRDAGKDFEFSGSFIEIKKEAERLEKTLSKLYEQQDEMRDLGKSVSSEGFIRLQRNIALASNKLDILKSQLEKVAKESGSLPPSFTIQRGGDGAGKPLPGYQDELKELKKDIKDIQETFGGIKNIPKGMLDNAIDGLKISLGELKKDFPNATKEITDFEEELKRLQTISAGLTKDPTRARVDTSSFDKVSEKSEEIRRKLEELRTKYEKSGLDFKFTGNFDKLKIEIEEVYSRLNGLKAKEREMISAGKVDTKDFEKLQENIARTQNQFTILQDLRERTEEFNKSLQQLRVPEIREENLTKLQNSLRKTEEETEKLRTKLENGITMGDIAPNVSDSGFRKLTEQIALSERRAEALRNRINEVGDANPQVGGWNKLSKAATVVSKSFGAIKQGIKGTVDSVKKIGRAFSELLSTIKKVSSAVGQLFNDMVRLAATPTSALVSSVKGLAGAFSKLKGESNGIQAAASGLGQLTKAAAGIATVGGIANLGKQAIKLGSDITEVENVVDTAFGAMADKAYAFAETATEKFGLSELAAKQYSGTMMSMLRSSNVAQKEAANMSVNLAGLAGDIASFYNIETDVAFAKLRSGMSGQTAAMKQLGINMNIANLEAYALAHGITKQYREMTIAEQTALRYNYIMDKSRHIQGDYAKTANTFANQLRLLKLNLQSIAAVIGQGLIAAILPAIKMLNKLMEKLMQAAKVFRDFMYVLFGKKIEAPARGAVDDMAGISDYTADMSSIGDSADDMADGMENTADGMEDATSSAKKLKKALSVLPIDQLNQLTGNMDNFETSKNKGTGIGKDKNKDSGFDNLGVGDMSGMFDDLYDKKEIEPVNKWAAAIRKAFLDKDWEGLGKIIAKMINIGLRKVYDGIKAITPKVEKALKDFAKAFNSFVKWLDWDLLGRTIGAGINLITKAINALTDPATGINFVELGKKFSVGFRGLANEVDWTGLGNSLGNLFMISWRIFEGLVDDMWSKSSLTGLNGWQELGRSLGEGVNGLFDKIDFALIANAITSGFRGILVSVTELLAEIRFDDIVRNINDGLQALYSGIKWDTIGKEITTLAAEIKKAFNDLMKLDFGLVGSIIGAGITDIVKAFNLLMGEDGIDFETFGSNISNGFRKMFEEIPWTELGHALGNGFMIGWRILDGFITDMSAKNDAGLTGWQQLGISLGDAVNGVFAKINFSDIASVLVGGINGAIDALKEYIETVEWEDIANNLSTGLNKIIHGIHWKEAGVAINDLIGEFLGMLLLAAQETDWEELGRNIGTFLEEIDWGGIFTKVFEIAKESIGGVISGFSETTAGSVVTGLVAAFGLMELTGIGLSVGNSISKELTGESIYSQIFDAITGEGGIISMMKENFGTGFSGIFGEEGLLSTVSAGATNLVTRIGNILGTIGSVIFSPTGLLIAGIALGAALIIMNWDSVSQVFVDFWENVLVPLGEFVSTVFAKVWSDILSPALQYLGETVLPVLSETIGNLWNNILVPLGEFLASVLGPVFATLGKIIGELWKNVLVPVAQFIGTVLAGAFEIGAAILNNVVIPTISTTAKIFQFLGENVLKPLIAFVGGVFANTLSSKFKAIGDIVKNLRKIFSGLIDFITGVFAGDWKKAWGGVKKVFEGVWGGLAGVVKKPINAIIGFINKMVAGMASGVNDIAKMLNNLKIDIPDWVPGIGGGKLGFNIPTWKPGKIPYLEQGGVLKRGQVGILEGNGAEAVVPLEKNRQWISKVSEEMVRTNRLYSGNGIGEDALANAVAEGVAMALMNNIQNLRSDNQQPINVTVKLQNDEAIARAAIRGQRSIDYRMNPTPQFG